MQYSTGKHLLLLLLRSLLLCHTTGAAGACCPVANPATPVSGAVALHGGVGRGLLAFEGQLPRCWRLASPISRPRTLPAAAVSAATLCCEHDRPRCFRRIAADCGVASARRVDVRGGRPLAVVAAMCWGGGTGIVAIAAVPVAAIACLPLQLASAVAVDTASTAFSEIRLSVILSAAAAARV